MSRVATLSSSSHKISVLSGNPFPSAVVLGHKQNLVPKIVCLKSDDKLLPITLLYFCVYDNCSCRVLIHFNENPKVLNWH